MKRRIKLTAGAFIIIAGIYFVYAYIFVPSILLPPLSIIDNSNRIGAISSPKEEIMQISQKYAELLAPLFPDAGDWRRQHPRALIMKDDRGLFLYRGEPEFSSDRRQIILSTCTIILPSNDTSLSVSDRFRRSLVLETRESVSMRFHRPLEITDSPDFSAFERGTLSGEVTIRSDMKPSGPEDDFSLTTRDISFTPSQILANNEVVFHFGRQQGEGEGLQIEMNPPSARRSSAPADSTAPSEPELGEDGNLGGGFSIAWITLQKLNRLQFQVKGNQFGSKNDPHVLAETQEEMQVDIRCKNRVHFAPTSDRLAEWAAQFTDDVEVVVYHENEKEDRLKCRNLFIYFVDRELQEKLNRSDPSLTGGRSKKTLTGRLAFLEPIRVKAIRSEEAPADIESPGTGVRGQGDEIVYEIPTKHYTLRSANDDEPVQLTRESATVTAGEIDYLAGKEKGAFGTLWANRRGTLQTVTVDQEGKESVFQASWKDGLQVVADPQDPKLLKLSTKGDVRLAWEQLGEIRAKEADFWIYQADGGTKNNALPNGGANDESFARDLSSIRPASARFRGDVRLTTPYGVGDIREELTLRFQEPAAEERSGGQNPPLSGAEANDGSKNSLFGDAVKSSFKMEGGRLDLWIVLGEKQLDIDRMVIRENILFTETQLDDAVESVRFEGDDVRITRPKSDRAAVELIGRPANFRGKGLDLSGYNIRVDQAKNLFSVVGRGKLTFIPNSDLGALALFDARQSARAPSDEPLPVDVRWSHAMMFDGQTLSFQGDEQESVFVQQKPSLELKSPEIRFRLKNSVRIFDLGQTDRQKLELATSECLGTYQSPVDVVYYGDFSDASGTGGGYYHAQVRTLRHERQSGDLYADGPGWFRGTIKTPQSNAAVADLGIDPLTSGSASNPWTHFHAIFNKNLEGNTQRKELTAVGKVTTVTATSASSENTLDAENRASFPEDAFFLTCDRLNFSQAVSENAAAAFETTASGNTLFRYEDYVGRGERIKYSHAKNTVILEGSGLNSASIHRQEQPGGEIQSNRFSRATFNLKTKKIEADVSSTTLDALTP